jgi:hypothetical protein
VTKRRAMPRASSSSGHSSSGEPGGAALSVVEWRAGGHRLAYVSAVVMGADQRPVELVTSPAVMGSGEFAVHLAEFVSLGRLSLRASDDFGSSRRILSLLRELRTRGRAVVLPEADKYLLTLVVGKLLRRLPRRMTIIVMRPPSTVATAGRIGQFAKRMLIVALMAWRHSIDVRLLEDPLAHGDSRCWQGPILGRRTNRLNDPCGLLDVDSAPLPADLEREIAGRQVLAVVGAIDARKNLPLVLEGWAASQPPDSVLLVAGHHSASVSSWLSENPLRIPPNTYFLNQYLTNNELRAVIERSRAIFTLYDGGISSGIVIGAAALGRWAIVSSHSRTASVASVHGFAIPCDPNPRDVARAIIEIIARGQLPTPVSLPNSEQFGRDILRAL